MELDNLKKSWDDMAESMDALSAKLAENANIAILSKKSDVRSRMLRRAYTGCAVTAICLMAMASYPLWGPGGLPQLWVSLFSVAIAAGLAAEVYITGCIKRLDIYKSSNAELTSRVARIKKSRRNFEIWADGIVVAFFIWLSFDAINIREALLFWTFAATGIGLGFIIYRRDVADFDEIANWCKR